MPHPTRIHRRRTLTTHHKTTNTNIDGLQILQADIRLCATLDKNSQTTYTYHTSKYNQYKHRRPTNTASTYTRRLQIVCHSTRIHRRLTLTTHHKTTNTNIDGLQILQTLILDHIRLCATLDKNSQTTYTYHTSKYNQYKHRRPTNTASAYTRRLQIVCHTRQEFTDDLHLPHIIKQPIQTSTAYKYCKHSY